MWVIGQKLRGGFINQIKGFVFNGKKISKLNDIRAAIDFIYKKKAVLYRKRSKNYSDRWSLGGNKAAKKALDDLLNKLLAPTIYKYFNKPGKVANNQSNFDEFHHEICQRFLDKLNKIRNMVGLQSATYGNAQKMINILFKYLACFDDYPKYADLFSYCHMPIDGYIARALNGNGVLVPSTPWNKLTYPQYIGLQKAIRINLPRDPNMTILEGEFILWPIVAKGRSCKGALLQVTSGIHAPRIPYFYM